LVISTIPSPRVAAWNTSPGINRSRVQRFRVYRYISKEALNGLFKLLGEEEKKIRTDPVARTTDILKTVFSN
jgi:hypothetical protein